MANHREFAGEQSTLPSLSYPTRESPVMEKFRRALNVMMTTFQSDLSSEDFLSRKILELSTSSGSIEEFLRSSMEFMDQSLAEHRRQTETMRASLKIIQAFLTSFISDVDESHGRSSGDTTISNNVPPSSRSVTPFVPPPNSLASPFSPVPILRSRRPVVSDDTQKLPVGTRVKNELSESISSLASPFVPIERRREPPPDLNYIFPPQLRMQRAQSQTQEEDLSVDVLQYFQGPLFPSTPPSTPHEAITPPNNHSTPSSFAGRPHPFVLRRVIRRHHLIRTPDGHTIIPPILPSSRYALDDAPIAGRPRRFRSAEPSPYYHVTKRPRRRLAFMNSKDDHDDYDEMKNQE
ncbi:hypothetical protein Clacol_004147 [Clathrus columnatus]|uniref:Uncharacterized protein n=1 Tax=Clathrus columnatus TaxID=1419009 RepID=A0AAV5A9S6_9AGAM|nr:hypothetical protein Clacol_004147 [Clathrus columnatus]